MKGNPIQKLEKTQKDLSKCLRPSEHEGMYHYKQKNGRWSKDFYNKTRAYDYYRSEKGLRVESIRYGQLPNSWFWRGNLPKSHNSQYKWGYSPLIECLPEPLGRPLVRYFALPYTTLPGHFFYWALRASYRNGENMKMKEFSKIELIYSSDERYTILLEKAQWAIQDGILRLRI